ncbi:MAG: prepilin-type N-terminal cleavage/methylation domain-containing protein [Synergistaceae bacterium]|jgi:prepilin-type N-terminal cleavage/methylation domain-containing protein|nr:prepilin-type N-terminal cleavage/methylation domain-containing protein [Synergistaceae bacterium]
MVKMRKGFTLVELLIVIVIIGILASSMMLSSGSATAAAEASNVVTELRNLKAATLMLFIDSMDEARGSGFATSINNGEAKDFLAKYMDNPEKLNENFLFKVEDNYAATGGTKWFVGYNLTGAKVTNEVKQKLAGRAQTTGLLGSTSTTTVPSNLTTYFEDTHNSIWMVAR